MRTLRSLPARLIDRYGIGFFAYGGVSVVSGLSEWLIFAAALSPIGPVAAALVGFVGATTVNFVLSRYFVFRSARAYGQELALVFLMSAVAFAANFFVFYQLYATAGVNPIYAKIIGTCSGFVFNYAARQFFIFSRVPRFRSISALTGRGPLREDAPSTAPAASSEDAAPGPTATSRAKQKQIH